MSVTSTVGQINTQINAYLPITVAAVLAVEQANHADPGATKLQNAVNVVLATLPLTQAIPNANVQAITSLASTVVSLLNAFGIFNHGAKPNIAPVPLTAHDPAAKSVTIIPSGAIPITTG